MTFGSLFSGVGGLDLGLERSGMRCRWQVEIEPWCQKVLATHWPATARYADVKVFPPPGEDFAVDLIAGGFPCQPVSAIAATSGKRKGVEDVRWLWPEFRHVVEAIRPRIVLIENVPGLISAGLGDVVRGDIERIGYATDPWTTIGACCVGAPHIRRRVFLVAYPHSTPLERRGILADLARATRSAARRPPEWQWSGGAARYRSPGNRGLGTGSEGWARDPGIRRVGDGVSSRVDDARIRGVGNAVVPQVAEEIGKRIVETFQLFDSAQTPERRR